MMGPSFRSLRAGLSGLPPHVTRHATAAAAALGPAVANSAGAALRVGSAVVAAGGAAVAWQQGKPEDELASTSAPSLPFVRELEERPSVREVRSPGQELRKHPVAKHVVEQDHLFDGMIASGQVESFRCWEDRGKKEFHSVVQLGKDVCGFPQTVHGGLTAAIMDETFGGLGVAMWRSGALGFRPPAYTARLELDYKKKIPAGATIVCSTQVEKVDDRKIWMKGQVTNGSGVVYAQARALFVAPKMRNVLWSWVPGMKQTA